MQYSLPVYMRGAKETFLIDYGACADMRRAGFDALSGFPPEMLNRSSYPAMHGRFVNMTLEGYRRYCGVVQLIERFDFDANGKSARSLNIDVPERADGHIVPYFAYGYPVEVFDAPCFNLRDSERLTWRAYTYIVDPPSRLSDYRLDYFAGYSWGYTEDKTGATDLLPFESASKELFESQISELCADADIILW